MMQVATADGSSAAVLTGGDSPALVCADVAVSIIGEALQQSCRAMS